MPKKEKISLRGKENKIPVWLLVISIGLPLIVASLYLLPKRNMVGGIVYAIPAFNAIINGLTIGVLIAGYVAIKRKNLVVHKALMLSAITLSVMFLGGYVAYHSQVESTSFGGQGIIRGIYFSLLISHIVLAAVIAPLILVTLLRALRGEFALHKHIAKFAYPAWLYVAVTGVIVYFMILPYY